jgi:hypothetical protein
MASARGSVKTCTYAALGFVEEEKKGAGAVQCTKVRQSTWCKSQVQPRVKRSAENRTKAWPNQQTPTAKWHPVVHALRYYMILWPWLCKLSRRSQLQAPLCSLGCQCQALGREWRHPRRRAKRGLPRGLGDDSFTSRRLRGLSCNSTRNLQEKATWLGHRLTASAGAKSRIRHG